MKKPFQNTTNSPMYVNSQMIPPGETYVVEVPDDGAAADEVVAPPTLADEAALILKGKVADIVDGLPGLNADALDMMTALEEQAAKPRTSLLTALADARMALADAKMPSDEL